LLAANDMMYTVAIAINESVSVGSYNLRVGITGMYKQSPNETMMLTLYSVLGAPNLDTQLLLYESSNVSVWMKNYTLVIAEPMPLSVKVGDLPSSTPLMVGLGLSQTIVYTLGCNPPYRVADYNTFGWLTNDYMGHQYFPSGSYSLNLYWYPSGINTTELYMYQLMMGAKPQPLVILDNIDLNNRSFIVHSISERTLTIGDNADLNITTAFNTSTQLTYNFMQKANGTITHNSSDSRLRYDSSKAYDQVTISVPDEGLSSEEGVETYIQFKAYNCLNETVLFTSSVQVNITSKSSSSSSSSGLGADAIVGIVIACVLIAAIASLWFLTKPKNQDYNTRMINDE